MTNLSAKQGTPVQKSKPVTQKGTPTSFDGIRLAFLPDPATSVRGTTEVLPSHGRSVFPLISLLLSRKLIFAGGIVTMLVVAVGFFVVAAKVTATISHSQGAGTSHAGHVLRQPTAITKGLVAWYPLDGNANDASGNGTNLTPSGSPTTTQGKFGKAYTFNGAQALSVAANASFDNLGSMTLSMWINPSDFSDPINQYQVEVVSWGGGGGALNYILSEYGGGGALRFCRNIAATAQCANSNTKLTNGTWQLVTVTFNSSSNLVAFYLNGLADGTTSWTAGTIMQNAYPLVVGSGGSTALIGSLDDVRIYNRVLSSTEITQLYQGSQPVNCDQYCVGWWKLDEGAGATAADSTSNGGNASYNNSPSPVAGIFGNGLSFNGSNQYLSGTDSALSAVTGAVTLSAWINPSGRANRTVLSTYNASGMTRLVLNSLNAMDFYVNGTRAVLSATGAVPNGIWTHIIATSSPIYSAIYINGVLSASAAFGIAPGGLNTAFNIGRDVSGGSEYFYGSLDDVRVYNRALADYEVYDQYLAGR